MMRKDFIKYKTENKSLVLKTDSSKETLLASLQQIADIFETDKSGISRHINNIYREGELSESSTVAKIATVQKEGNRSITRTVKYYNLDMIISIGYRVNSNRATKFRQWATKVLKEVVLKKDTVSRYYINNNFRHFESTVKDILKLIPNKPLESNFTKGLVEIIDNFAYTWLSLDAYDKKQLPKSGSKIKKLDLTAEELLNGILKLKGSLINQNIASELFAIERDSDNLRGIIRSVYQSFNGEDVYKSLEEKAANLLYLVVKNHPFIDGNKRVGAFSFIWFLTKAGMLNPLKMTPEVLTTLTILIAQSDTKDKDTMIGLVLQLLKN